MKEQLKIFHTLMGLKVARIDSMNSQYIPLRSQIAERNRQLLRTYESYRKIREQLLEEINDNEQNKLETNPPDNQD